MQCNDGVLIASDSASITTAGKVSNTGTKHLSGLRNGQAFALAFAGYAGIENGPQTLAVIAEATRISTGNLVSNIGGQLVDWLYTESFRGRKRMRKEFRRIGHVRVFVSLGFQEWWVVHATPRGFSESQIGHRLVVIGQPGPDPAAWKKLGDAVKAAPEWLVDGKREAGTLFELASQLFPSAVRYPGAATIHSAKGIKTISFKNQAELI